MQLRNTVGLAAIAAALATAAEAQTEPAPSPPPDAPGAADGQGVISYGPDFFAAQNPATALDMVNRLPGFTFDAGANARGLEGNAGNVLIDGQRSASKTETLDEILRRTPASQVVRIDVIRGGASGIDMQGRTVLANVIRRSGASLTGSVQASSLYETVGDRWRGGFRAEMTRRWEGRALELSAVLAQSIDDGTADGYRIRVDASGAPLILSDLEAEAGGPAMRLSGAYETPLFGGRLRLHAIGVSNPYQADYRDTIVLPVNGGVETEHLEIDDEDVEFGARYTRDIGERLSLELVGLERLGRNDVFDDFRSLGAERQFDLRSRTGETVLHGDLNWRRSERLTFKFGAEGAFNWLESETALTFDGVDIPLPAANVRVEELRGEVLAEAAWRPSARFNIEAGLHVETSTITAEGDSVLEKTLTYPKPRFRLTWSPGGGHQLRLRAERVVGQLNFDDFVAASSVANTGAPIAGNPDIVPEQTWLLEGVYEYRFWGDGVASVTASHAQIEDVIDRIPLAIGADVIDAPGNIGSGTRSELTLALTLPLARLGLAGAQFRPSVTWRRTEVTDPVTGETREISGVRPFEWEAHFTHDLPQWRLNWGFDIFGGFQEDRYRVAEISTFELHTYVSMFAEYKPRPNVILRAEVGNVTGRDAINTREVYEGPRNTSAVAFTDTRTAEPGPFLILRARRTFG